MSVRLFSSTRRLSQAVQNHYEILGVKVNATSDEIKKQFFDLSKKYHPDRNKDADPERYQQITQAYTVLSNEAERRKFDQSLGSAVRRPQGYHSGRTWGGNDPDGGPRRRPGMSGYNYNSQTRWRVEQAHAMRTSSKLDPLRPEHQSKTVPHFNFAKHAESHARQDRYREEILRRASKSSMKPKSAATASMGDGRPLDPHSAGTSFMMKAAGVVGVGVGFLYLLLR